MFIIDATPKGVDSNIAIFSRDAITLAVLSIRSRIKKPKLDTNKKARPFGRAFLSLCKFIFRNRQQLADKLR